MSSIALDNMINRAVETAMENKNKEIAINMRAEGLSLEQIAKIINCKIDIVKDWLSASTV